MSMHHLNKTARLILLLICLSCKVETRRNSSITILSINSTNNTTKTATEILHNKAKIGLSIWCGSLFIATCALVLGMLKLMCFNAKQEDENLVVVYTSIDSGEDNIVNDR